MRKLGIFIAAMFALGLIGSFFSDGKTNSTSKSGETIVATSVKKGGAKGTTPTKKPITTSTVPPASTKRYKVALSNTRITKDPVEGITWYRARTSPTYVNRNGFFLYIGRETGKAVTLRFKIQYFGSDWLFINSYIINVDGTKYEIQVDSGDLNRDNDSDVWEWYDVIPSSENIAMLKAISTSKHTVVRMVGDQYKKDVVISTTQKQALSTMFTVYTGLGGALDSF